MKKVVPPELLERSSVTAPPGLATGLPNWSCTWRANGTDGGRGADGLIPVGVEVKTSLLGAPAVIVNGLVWADVIDVCVESVAVMV